MSKGERRRLRELAGKAYERELARELDQVLASFEAWKRGEIDPFELSDRIHRFHQGPARKLFSFYVQGDAETSVARGVLEGLLTEAEVGEELMAKLNRMIEHFRWARGHEDGAGNE